ncbi:uncharacterized protein LOC131880926 [Tigriopus californicus]|uniref:uncharacterized protein LOC131880926 n=1 Tax=Tigriopus californicus TaxID=6832 RepID=UPI0027DA919D|nr:uncharacterized protein LOC131880926 [Tigriopus californicus]
MSTCQWDTTWDVDFDQITCVATHCYDIIPNNELSHNLRAEIQGTMNYSSPLRLPFGESFEYRCLEGLKFAEDPSGSNDSFQVLCTKDNGYQFPSSFPKCVANTTCILPSNIHSTQKHTDTPLETEFTNGEMFK